MQKKKKINVVSEMCHFAVEQQLRLVGVAEMGLA